MKMMIPLPENADPKFDGVARSIAKGNPPKWLLVGLTQFSQGIGFDTSGTDNFDTIVERMQDAAHVLLTSLPIYKHLGFGLPCPEEVALALQVLPRIQEDLDRLAKLKNRKGRRPDAQREVCAAVIAIAWKLLHGKPEPRSDKLLEACYDYWRACGGKQIGEVDGIENWRRPVERALATGHEWIEQFLLAVQNSH